MKIIHRVFPFAAVSIAAACATSPNSGSGTPPSQGQSSNVLPGGGGSSGANILPVDAGTIGNISVTPMGADMDSGVSLGADGGVVGTCAVGRHGCDPMCDELVENGKHEYIEPKPDDGSPLPPANVASMFSGAPSTTGGPCILEPQDGSLFPNNWLRPRIYFTVPGNQTIFQIRIHAARQMNDLVVYTQSRTWEIPKDIWQSLGASTWGEDITVTVSAVGAGGGTPVSSQVKFQIAPAAANGSMVYWAAVGDKNGLSWLEGFGVGDEGVSKLLTATQVQSRLSRDQGGGLTMRDPDNNTAVTPGTDLCIGCHVAVPDQQSVAFLDFYPWPGVTARVDSMGTAGAVPPWLSDAGGEALSQPWLGMLTFSNDVWNSGAHRVVSTYAIAPGQIPWQGPSYSGPPNSAKIAPRLVWIDLSSTAAPALVNPMTMMVDPHLNPQEEMALAANAGTSFGFIATNGDTRGAESPAWSHDGKRIVYASTDMGKDGRLAGQVGNPQTGTSDLYAVDYNGGAGGNASPLKGAAESAWDEFYPAFSPDDKFVAFDRVPNADGIRYYAPNAEVFVIDANGGNAVRIKANDPPACMTQINTGKPAVSPGVTNSWPRWSPEYPTCSDGKTYYWLIFSSSRLGRPFAATNFKQGLSYSEPTSQLYLTALVVDKSGTVSADYPGIFIWNQPISNASYPGAGAMGANQSNHTPSWEVVEIPPPMPSKPPPPPR